MIARAVPPPDKLKGHKEPDDDEEGGPDDADEDDDAKYSAMEQLLDVLGVKSDPEKAKAACEALENYLDTAGYSRG
jgi:hypothetical protein